MNAETLKKLTKDELAIVKEFAEDMPQKSMIFSPKGYKISPRWLFSMANEIRLWRNVGSALVELVNRKEARIKTAGVLTGIIDDLQFANLKLRVSLDSIEYSLSLNDCIRIAKEAL